MADLPIGIVKQQLQNELGLENFSLYLLLLRDWFGQRMTKQMFDFEVESLFPGKCLDLHNQLLRSILRQCVTGSDGEAPGSAGVLQPNVPSHSQVSTGSAAVSTANSTPSLNTAALPPKVEPIINESSIYIIPTIPGEEPFLYPPNARECPPVVEAAGAVDWLEQETPVDCDWLHPVEITCPANENDISKPQLNRRLPPWAAHDYQCVNTTSYTHDINVVTNVTHFYPNIKGFTRKPNTWQHFIPPPKKGRYLSSGCSLHGKFLCKAWNYDVPNVNPQVTDLAVKAVRDHLKNVLTAIIQQRRPFRMRDKRILHSMGVPYPNPYLRQGLHLYDEAYSTETTKMADVVMQIPAPFPTMDEKERLAALQVSASHPSKESRFISNKGTMMDFLCAIEHNPAIIPHTNARFKLLDKLLRKCKGYSGSYNAEYGDGYDYDDDSLQPSPLLPLVSY